MRKAFHLTTGYRTLTSVSVRVPVVTESKQRSVIERFLGRPKSWIGWVWVALSVCWFVLAVIDPSPFRFFIAATWLLVGVLNLVGAYVYRRRGQRSDTSAEPTWASSSDSTTH